MAEFLVLVVSLFVIINPFASMPMLIAFYKSRDMQRKAALDASIAAAVILVIFALFGLSILTFMGISLPAFMIAGGLMLLVLGFEFIFGKLPRSRQAVMEPADVIVPIGTPLLAGPGAITTAIYFSGTYGLLSTLVAVMLTMVLTFAFLFSTSFISQRFGKNGLKILTRIMGMLTAGIALSLIEHAFVLYGILPA